MTQRATQNASHARTRRTPVYQPIIPLPSDSFVWRSDDYSMSWSVWYQHPECEIHLIRSSTGTCHAGDYIGPFHPGDLYLIGRNVPHGWVTPPDSGMTIMGRDIVVQFDQDRLLHASASLPELRQLNAMPGEENMRVTPLAPMVQTEWPPLEYCLSSDDPLRGDCAQACFPNMY